jgi:hypothetical protein
MDNTYSAGAKLKLTDRAIMLHFGPSILRLKPPSAASADALSFILCFVESQRSWYSKSLVFCLVYLYRALFTASTLHFLRQ